MFRKRYKSQKREEDSKRKRTSERNNILKNSEQEMTGETRKGEFKANSKEEYGKKKRRVRGGRGKRQSKTRRCRRKNSFSKGESIVAP